MSWFGGLSRVIGKAIPVGRTIGRALDTGLRIGGNVQRAVHNPLFHTIARGVGVSEDTIRKARNTVNDVIGGGAHARQTADQLGQLYKEAIGRT